MPQGASDLLAEVADRLSTDATQSGMVVAEAVRAIEPELLKGYKDGSIDELVNMSVNFLRALFRSLRPDSKLPWPEYYTQAREDARRDAAEGARRSGCWGSGRARCGFATAHGSSWPRRSACSRARRTSSPPPGGRA